MKKRLDVLLFERDIYPSREKAKSAIGLGRVIVDGKMAKKPSELFENDAKIEALPFEFVSRGGFKLQFALENFGITLKDKVVLDIGASTGGFSDVCLQSGAKKIYAVDTGEGQLAEKIRSSEKVINMERTNFLDVDKSKFSDVQFVCIDVSFVSLTKLAQKLADDFEKVEIVALIKPQFECGIDYARKHKGIVKDEKMHKKIVENINRCFQNVGFEILGTVTSPIKGGDGNVEFLSLMRKS